MDFTSVNKRTLFTNLLKQGFVFRLKGEQPFESSDYHVFVVLNYNPNTGDVLYVVNGTSQVEKRLRYLWAQSIDTNKTTVAILSGKYSFFSKDTLINCNSVSELNVSTLDFSDDTVELIYDSLVDEDIAAIITAVKESPLVEEYIKSEL